MSNHVSTHIPAGTSLYRAAALALVAATISTDTLAGEVKTERVSFESKGETLVGTLYLPEEAAEGPRPAIVVTGAWMTVKEQMPARYAREMADRGYVALAFDFRGWGESGGERRQKENPKEKIEDIEAAAAWLATRPEADGARLGGLGICASSGYMAGAAIGSSAIKSVAFVAPWLHDRAIIDATYGGAEVTAKLEAAADSAEKGFRETGEQAFLPAASATDATAIMYQAPYYTEPDHGLIAAWRNEADPAFWRDWLAFDALELAGDLKQPFLMVHSDKAAIPQGAKAFYAALTAPKQELWLTDVTQFDFYDVQAPVKTAADAVADHFARTLGDPAEL